MIALVLILAFLAAALAWASAAQRPFGRGLCVAFALCAACLAVAAVAVGVAA